jgi:hypothetical protein
MFRKVVGLLTGIPMTAEENERYKVLFFFFSPSHLFILKFAACSDGSNCCAPRCGRTAAVKTGTAAEKERKVEDVCVTITCGLFFIYKGMNLFIDLADNC